eukprot:scaffold979_cov107-Skeletonema_dohrnii-CCMP3373.AAC.1
MMILLRTYASNLLPRPSSDSILLPACMKACEFQSDNYKLHCGVHVLSQELRGVRFQMAKCKGMNERLGKKNEERKKDNQSLGYPHDRDGLQRSTKATRRLRDRNVAMQGATHHITDVTLL